MASRHQRDTPTTISTTVKTPSPSESATSNLSVSLNTGEVPKADDPNTTQSFSADGFSEVFQLSYAKNPGYIAFSSAAIAAQASQFAAQAVMETNQLLDRLSVKSAMKANSILELSIRKQQLVSNKRRRDEATVLHLPVKKEKRTVLSPLPMNGQLRPTIFDPLRPLLTLSHKRLTGRNILLDSAPAKPKTPEVAAQPSQLTNMNDTFLLERLRKSDPNCPCKFLETPKERDYLMRLILEKIVQHVPLTLTQHQIMLELILERAQQMLAKEREVLAKEKEELEMQKNELLLLLLKQAGKESNKW